jgi:Kdo2-lipid IVA lauroyltransferase/acyltransferase
MIEDEFTKAPTLSHRLEYVVYRGFEGFLSLLPLDLVSRFGAGLGLIAWAVSGKHRRLVTRNLRIATAVMAPTPAELQRMVRETFLKAGSNLLSSLRAALMTPGNLRKALEFSGLEHIRTPTGSGRGVALVWSHMGNWEMLAQIFPVLGEHVHGGPIYRPLENPLLDRLTVERRTQQGAVVFNKHDGFNGPAGLLRSGGVVSIMTDQRAGGHGELCPFFGRLSSCTPLPALLARRTRAAMVTLSITSLQPGRWRIRIRPVPDGARTPEILVQLETAMRDQLTDVFWFHDRWRIDKTRPLSFYTKQSPTESARLATVPTRLLATLPPGNADSAETLRRILELRPDARIDVLDPGDLPPLPEDRRIVRIPWDRSAPPEHLDSLLKRIDESHPAPLDFALLLDGNSELAKAAKSLGLRSIIGCQVTGKPWTRSFPTPHDLTGWRELAEALAATPSSGAQ